MREKGVYLAVDEFKISWALEVAVSRSILGACFVCWVLGHATVGVHGDKVQSAVEPTRELRDIDVKGEFLASHLKFLVLSVARHEV